MLYNPYLSTCLVYYYTVLCIYLLCNPYLHLEKVYCRIVEFGHPETQIELYWECKSDTNTTKSGFPHEWLLFAFMHR
ncbi:hypothetical protein EYC84_008012 [Monilinia fructicola]|uniref:Uncharacterized protein n=1 Tax=Monilinia fructicola TaxID=38448 RepID=A0A5M9JII2_MONFR|nr:hypothetical protein EYC84_008012 [Monilinia fructicola]